MTRVKQRAGVVPYLAGILAPLGGGGGPFLFLAEQTEQDSSEQLLPEEPDVDWKQTYLRYK